MLVVMKPIHIGNRDSGIVLADSCPSLHVPHSLIRANSVQARSQIPARQRMGTRPLMTNLTPMKMDQAQTLAVNWLDVRKIHNSAVGFPKLPADSPKRI